MADQPPPRPRPSTNPKLRGWETLQGNDDTRLIDPTAYVAKGSLLFIDTNVFMDTNPTRKGGVTALVERCSETILRDGNPIIVPSKVVDELAKHASKAAADVPPDKAEAFAKAATALRFIEALAPRGLIRNDLGDVSNPYADDLFIVLFEALSARYAMALVTNDLTLQMRIRLVAAETRSDIVGGQLTQDGMIDRDPDQTLYERGFRKLERIAGQLSGPKPDPKDQREWDSLVEVLRQFKSVFRTIDPQRRQTAPRTPASPTSTAPRTTSPAAFALATEVDGEDTPLPVASLPVSGTKVTINGSTQRETVILGQELGTGGEGSAYLIDGGRVVKIFDRAHTTRHREAKLRLLTKRRLDAEGIAFPQSIVTNSLGEFVGYVMPQAHGRELQHTIFKPGKLKERVPPWTKSDLVDVCISFLEKVIYLHDLKVLIGDINPKNLLVDEHKRVSIIDADSWQIEGYPCPVGTPMFTAPSISGRAYSEFLRTEEDERFAVATMLFMILITGQFPYARKGAEGDITKAIGQGRFAFQFKEKSNRDQPAGNWKYMWSHLPVDIKGLFWNTFHKDGDRYNDRPTEREWLVAFQRYRQYLSSDDNFDPMSNDVFPTRYKARARDTPIYECVGCGTSLAGIWSDARNTYSMAQHCENCRRDLPKCSDCGRSKPQSALQEGRCYACNRTRNYAACVSCGTETRIDKLRDGRCYNCNQGTCPTCLQVMPLQLLTYDKGQCFECFRKSDSEPCASCGRTMRKHELTDGLCARCLPIPCTQCGTNRKPAELHRGRCSTCIATDNELDLTRLCTRCGNPFITNGNVAWHIRMRKRVPDRHKAIGNSYPAECVPLPVAAPLGSGSSANRTAGRVVVKAPPLYPTGGKCFIATAVYGSYDAPEVRVLRRWRDGTLSTTPAGRAVIRTYYRLSPGLVRLVGDKDWFARPTRQALNAFVRYLRGRGISTAPYLDRNTEGE